MQNSSQYCLVVLEHSVIGGWNVGGGSIVVGGSAVLPPWQGTASVVSGSTLAVPKDPGGQRASPKNAIGSRQPYRL